MQVAALGTEFVRVSWRRGVICCAIFTLDVIVGRHLFLKLASEVSASILARTGLAAFVPA